MGEFLQAVTDDSGDREEGEGDDEDEDTGGVDSSSSADDFTIKT